MPIGLRRRDGHRHLPDLLSATRPENIGRNTLESGGRLFQSVGDALDQSVNQFVEDPPARVVTPEVRLPLPAEQVVALDAFLPEEWQMIN